MTFNAVTFDACKNFPEPLWIKASGRTSYNSHDAASHAGRISDTHAQNVQVQRAATITASPGYVRLRRKIKEILQDCSVPDWDGYDAKPIDKISVQLAYQFILLLPLNISHPDLCPEPNGDLGMAWRKNGYHIALAVDRDGVLSWGGISPRGRLYGTSLFSRDAVSIPQEVLSVLSTVEGIRS